MYYTVGERDKLGEGQPQVSINNEDYYLVLPVSLIKIYKATEGFRREVNHATNKSTHPLYHLYNYIFFLQPANICVRLIIRLRYHLLLSNSFQYFRNIFAGIPLLKYII